MSTVAQLEGNNLKLGHAAQHFGEQRAAQGHHRLRNSSGCVEKYRRDDILPALRCQRSILSAMSGGLGALYAIVSGHHYRERARAAGDMRSPRFPSDTEDEAESEDGAAALDEREDVDSVASEEEDEVMIDGKAGGVLVTSIAGPGIVNSLTGWCHRAVKLASGSHGGLEWQMARVGKACRRPDLTLGHFHEVRPTDPFFEHSGCFRGV